jgi:hypothetical protein
MTLMQYFIDSPDYKENDKSRCPTFECCPTDILNEDLACLIRNLLPAGKFWERTERDYTCHGLNCGVCLECETLKDPCYGEYELKRRNVMRFFDTLGEMLESVKCEWAFEANEFDPISSERLLLTHAQILGITALCDNCPIEIRDDVYRYIIALKIEIQQRSELGLVIPNYENFEAIANRFGVHLEPITDENEIALSGCFEDVNCSPGISTRFVIERNKPDIPINDAFDFPQSPAIPKPVDYEKFQCEKFKKLVVYKFCLIDPSTKDPSCFNPIVRNLLHYKPQELPFDCDKIYMSFPIYYDALREALKCELHSLMPRGMNLCLVNCC